MYPVSPAGIRVGSVIEDRVPLKLLGNIEYVSQVIDLTAYQLLMLPRMTVPVAKGIRWSLNHYDWELTPHSPSPFCPCGLNANQIVDWFLGARAEETLNMRCYRVIVSQWKPQGRVHNSSCKYFYEEAGTMLSRADQLKGTVDCRSCYGAYQGTSE